MSDCSAPTCGCSRDAMIGCLNFFHSTGAERPIFDNSPHAPGVVYALSDEHVDQIIYNSAGAVVNLAVEVRQLRAEVKRLMALNKERTDGINAANRRAYLADDRLSTQVAEAWDQRERFRVFANGERDRADRMAAQWKCDDPLHPYGGIEERQRHYVNWLEFAEVVCRPIVESDNDEAVQAAMVLYRQACPYYIATALAMAANRVSNDQADSQ